MTYKEKTEILEKYRYAVKLATYYQEEINQYRMANEQAKTQRITGMPGTHGNNADLSNYVEKLEEMQGQMYDQLIKAEKLKTNIIVWCESLDDVNQRLVIKYHYLHFHNFRWISDQMNFSRRTVERMRRSAIENLPDPDFDFFWI